ncbi:MAG: hypothetical protein KJ609_06985 [Gammaproteobacteria bacterium]|nr:hypothetical protein [Gammaproteobacteria bacterium]MBU1467259.1 hypothetical protein [Gammaproteobacteria bacterium]MBU2024895.1 hypothetical protein [Gammaproteobacteria bacterium]MBU2239359.1 hypothetical protein [Gammaproteobacteria bacterium]MBU2318278.1 hypothetical protein [Gammaproteobacteria bacterium]
MESLGIVIQLFFVLIMVAVPVYCAFRRFSFLKLHLVSIPVMCLMMAIAVYWPHFYADLRLYLMDFDFDGMSDAERARNVAPEQRELATKLSWSNMGIGWPLKAMIGMVFLSPYPTVVWILSLVLRKVRDVVCQRHT